MIWHQSGAQLDIGVIGVVTLHLGLRQKIVCNKILEPTVFRSGASEELAEGTIEAALKAVFCGVVSALRIDSLHAIKCFFLVVRENLQETVKASLIIRLGISVIPTAVQVVDALQEGISKCSICHPIKDFFYIHDMYLRNVFLDTTVLDK